MILLEDLPPAARSAICNGCGSKGGPFRWLKPPRLCFTEACDEHDLAYWIGGDARAKREADDWLWVRCRVCLWAWQQQKRRGRVGVWLRYAAAWVFWMAVRIGGRWSFHYGTPRGVADVVVLSLRIGANP